jgi:hypothetical protein
VRLSWWQSAGKKRKNEGRSRLTVNVANGVSPLCDGVIAHPQYSKWAVAVGGSPWSGYNDPRDRAPLKDFECPFPAALERM